MKHILSHCPELTCLSPECKVLILGQGTISPRLLLRLPQNGTPVGIGFCKWDGCGMYFQRPEHLQTHIHKHTIPWCDQGEQVRCLWSSCNKKILMENMTRHVDTHCFMYECALCGDAHTWAISGGVWPPFKEAHPDVCNVALVPKLVFKKCDFNH